MPATREIETPKATRREDGNGANSRKVDKPEASKEQETQMSVEVTKQEVIAPEGSERTRTGRVFSPAIDIYETPEAVVLVADMPGASEKSVDVTLEKNVLTIYGRVEPRLPEGHTLAYSEYGTGDYQRSFTISNAIDWERIGGKVRNGVLTLTLPKAGPSKTRKIEIASA